MTLHQRHVAADALYGALFFALGYFKLFALSHSSLPGPKP